jgi:hypothetical protein
MMISLNRRYTTGYNGLIKKCKGGAAVYATRFREMGTK